jgi:FAD-linked oxidoreductase
MSYKNWSGSVKFNPKEIVKPSSIEEVKHIVKDAVATNRKIRVVGSGHSFSPVIETKDILLSLDNLQGLISSNKELCQADVYAGTKLHVLGPILFDLGMAQENMGDINVQSIAGALSTGTHGTGSNLQTLSNQLIEITIVNGKEEIEVLKKSDNDFKFKCAQTSLGTLGIIVKMKLQLIPAYKLHYEVSKINFTNCINQIDSLVEKNRNVEFYYFPYTNVCQLKVMNFTDDKLKTGGIFKVMNDVLLENIVYYFLCKISVWFNTHKLVSKISVKGISSAKYVNWSHKIYATKRYVKFNEMEFNIPKEKLKDALVEIKEMIVAHKIKVNFPIECRFVKQDDIPLSPAYERESAYIAVHMYKTRDYKDYFTKVAQIVEKYNGRPHWGKRNFLQASDFSKLYPKWEEFHQVRKEMDPKGVFMSDYLSTIFE